MGNRRDELEALSRSDLVDRATALGVERANVLTRPELIDEIVSASVADENERTIARGLLGRARDLVARVVEKGLHLPDAAQRLRTFNPTTAPNDIPKPIPTVALAQVYANQGHRKQARRVINEVLDAAPDNAAAKAFLDQLDGKSAAESAPVADAAQTEQPASASASESQRSPRANDGQPLEGVVEPPADGPPEPSAVPLRDELSVDRDSGRLKVTWSIRPLTFARSRARLPAGRMVLRLARTKADAQGPALITDDIELDRLAGSKDIALPEVCLSSHVALGWRDGGTFVVLVTER